MENPFRVLGPFQGSTRLGGTRWVLVPIHPGIARHRIDSCATQDLWLHHGNPQLAESLVTVQEGLVPCSVLYTVTVEFRRCKCKKLGKSCINGVFNRRIICNQWFSILPCLIAGGYLHILQHVRPISQQKSPWSDVLFPSSEKLWSFCPRCCDHSHGEVMLPLRLGKPPWNPMKRRGNGDWLH